MLIEGGEVYVSAGAYPNAIGADDYLGSKCDEAVVNDSVFMQHADNSYSVRDRREDPSELVPYNEYLVAYIQGQDGVIRKCVTARSLGLRKETANVFSRLMTALPKDKLVLIADHEQRWPSHHPDGDKPLGIRISSVSEAILLVTEIPTYTNKQVKGLPKEDRDRVLTRYSKKCLLDALREALVAKSVNLDGIMNPSGQVIHNNMPSNEVARNNNRRRLLPDNLEAKYFVCLSYICTIMGGVFLGEAVMESGSNYGHDQTLASAAGALMLVLAGLSKWSEKHLK